MNSMIELTLGKRGSHKTTNLIKRCYRENKKENNLTYIVCLNRERVLSVMKLAQQLGVDIPFPMTMEELLSYHSYGRSYIKNVLIDDIDSWLQQQVRFNILEVTASIE